jgi:hypothetical protein
MTLMELGAIGEFVGAIAVVVTLVYLAIQIRQNTHAMAEGRRLALAQTYQMRADALQEMLVHAAESEHIGPIITKLVDAGYPEDVQSLDALTTCSTSTSRASSTRSTTVTRSGCGCGAWRRPGKRSA